MKKLRSYELKRLTPEEFYQARKHSLVVVLDNVRSLNNIGSVFRTADAFLLEAIYLCGITAKPPHHDIHKTALGAEDTVPWVYFENTMEAVENLKEKGYRILAIEQVDKSTLLQNWAIDKEQRYAIVLGNEVKGVQQAVVEECDECLEIPQYGTKHSLNVSISAGIIIWHYINKLNR